MFILSHAGSSPSATGMEREMIECLFRAHQSFFPPTLVIILFYQVVSFSFLAIADSRLNDDQERWIDKGIESLEHVER